MLSKIHGSSHVSNIDLSLEKLASCINSEKEIITKIYKLPLYNDEPKIFGYSALYKTNYDYNSDIASGFSFNKKIALIRVLGEAIERYCLDQDYSKSTVYSTEEKLKYYHLAPQEMVYFSEQQFNNNKFSRFRVSKKSKFNWMYGTSAINKRPILIPTQLAIFNYKVVKNEPIILFPMSTGAATGLSLDEALYRGICEIVERDAFMISYLNKINSPRIDLLSIDDPEINKILYVYKRYKLELVVLDITTDLQIPAFLAVTLDRTGLGPSISIGLKAGFDIKRSIIGAIEESLMTRSWIRDKFVYSKHRHKKVSSISDIEERAYFWFSISRIKLLDFWLENNDIKKINIKAFKRSENELEKAIKLFKDKKIRVIYADITDEKVKKYNFVVVKVIIPNLHPLFLDERYPYLGGKRLYQAPVLMGVFKKAKTENQLNKIPHPFL